MDFSNTKADGKSLPSAFYLLRCTDYQPKTGFTTPNISQATRKVATMLKA